ncbi:hypothetical protein BgAZ_110100 [Babesia gibsoni]|uniref:Sugar phosphate transporter domain-containing protein n=1 Tax=Babesia gibsoni TaxID=33632 RepID=A0AAD8PGS9_BABGI|nr:hypothetical protein BgAZ_110100 [Babesia gibsoni]
MGSSVHEHITPDDYAYAKEIEEPLKVKSDKHKDADFDNIPLSVVRRNTPRNMKSTDTADTEAYEPPMVLRDGGNEFMETARLMTVSLPHDAECDTDYEHSSCESVLEISEAYIGQDDDEDDWTFVKFLKHLRSKIEFFAYVLIFIITNSAQPLLICVLRGKGGTPNGTYTFLIPTYLAMICVGYYPTKKSIWEESWYYPTLLAVLDVLHQVIEKAGLIYCGASIYSIASSTNTMFLALLSNVVLKRKISLMAWLSISLISGSIAMNGMSQMDHITAMHVLGFFLVVIAAMINAFSSVISEYLLKRNEIEGPNLVSMMGMVSLSIFCAWSLVFTIPQRHVLFDSESEINPFDLPAVLSLLMILFVTNFFRSSVYYHIIKEAGSVSCGVLKAVRIVVVVIGSHLLFSCVDKTQAITASKLFSSFICSLGVILYSLERSMNKEKEE